jgi:hypothetical protein
MRLYIRFHIKLCCFIFDALLSTLNENYNFKLLCTYPAFRPRPLVCLSVSLSSLKRNSWLEFLQPSNFCMIDNVRLRFQVLTMTSMKMDVFCVCCTV